MVNTRSSRRDTQAAVFQAAAQEFAERGFDAARVDRIAARARVNKAMLYYHYGSKQALYDAVLRDMLLAVGTRARAIADGTGAAPAKLDAWIATVVEEAAARPWFPPIMLREIASGGRHLDPEAFGQMNAVYLAVRDVIAQGQREGDFCSADPLLTHMTILPAILIFFARKTVIEQRRGPRGLAAGEPRSMDEFVHHMQAAAQGMLRQHR